MCTSNTRSPPRQPRCYYPHSAIIRHYWLTHTDSRSDEQHKPLRDKPAVAPLSDPFVTILNARTYQSIPRSECGVPRALSGQVSESGKPVTVRITVFSGTADGDSDLPELSPQDLLPAPLHGSAGYRYNSRSKFCCCSALGNDRPNYTGVVDSLLRHQPEPANRLCIHDA
jgi:hypothetical protein